MIIKCQKTETEQDWTKQKKAESTQKSLNIITTIIVISALKEVVLFILIVLLRTWDQKEYMEVENRFTRTSTENINPGSTTEKQNGKKNNI